jgi:hypothetical protein
MRYFLYAILFVLAATVIAACGSSGASSDDIARYEWERYQEQLRNANDGNTNFSYQLTSIGCDSGTMPSTAETAYYDYVNDRIRAGARYLYDVYGSQFQEDVSYWLYPMTSGSSCRAVASGNIIQDSTARTYTKNYQSVSAIGCNKQDTAFLQQAIKDEGSVQFELSSGSGSLVLNDLRDPTSCIKSDGSAGKVQYRYTKKAG